MNNWLQNLHHSMEGHSLGEDGANVITRLLIQQIEDADRQFQPHNADWESDVLQALRLCIKVEEGSKTAQAYVLALIKRNWDQLSLEFRKAYNYQFDVLVMRETGTMPSTMDNYVRTAETFFVAKRQPLGQIEVPVYDQYKKPVMKNGSVVTRFVDFDPTVPPITKLNLVRSLAEQDKMTPKLWSMVMDKEVTVDALKKEMYSDNGSTSTKTDPSLKFILRGDRIVAKEFGEEIEVGEIYWDNLDTELGRTAIRRLLMTLQIPFEEDQIARTIQQAHNQMIVRIYENGGRYLIDDHSDD